jgi:hypothetical protein
MRPFVKMFALFVVLEVPFVVLAGLFVKFRARRVNWICPFPIPAGLTGPRLGPGLESCSGYT